MIKEYKTYNGNDIFNINFNLYNYEGVKIKKTLQAIKKEFEIRFRDDLKTVLTELGLKYIRLEVFTPKYYNYQGDSIDLTIEVIDVAKYKKAIQKHEKILNEKLAENKSYDGYILMTANSIKEEILNTYDDNFFPDVLCLAYLIQDRLNFSNNIDIEDYFMYYKEYYN